MMSSGQNDDMLLLKREGNGFLYKKLCLQESQDKKMHPQIIKERIHVIR